MLRLIPKLSLIALVLVCAVTLLFGIWPLNFFAKNQVRWLDQQDAVQFYKQGLSNRRATGGVIYSTHPLDISIDANRFEPVTIEICLESHQPKDRRGGLAHILSVYDGHRRSLLVISQWKSHLVIRSRDNSTERRDIYREIGIEKNLGPHEKNLVTIASGLKQTQIYLNGELAKSFARQSLIGLGHFCGHLNLGNSSTGHNAWVGNLYGLALYDQFLTPEQIQQHHLSWSQNKADLTAIRTADPLLLYDFAKRSDPIVHNQVNDRNHLFIPRRFKPLKKGMDLCFWQDMQWSRGALTDILINVFGFIPLASCLLLCLHADTLIPPHQINLITVLTCAISSLAIELIQLGLPTRTPSLLDLLCNTVGAALGVLVFKIIRQKLPLLKEVHR